MMMSFLWEHSAVQFLVLSVVIGGGAAWMAGRALALSWRPFTLVALYMLVLGAAVRFFHFALLDGTLLSARFYVIDTMVLLLAAGLSYRLARTSQMIRQYPWLYRRTSPWSWSDK